MRVELAEDFGQRLFNKVRHVYLVDVLRVDYVQQVVELVARCIYYAESVSGKMVCVKAADCYSGNYAARNNQRYEARRAIRVHSGN